MVKYTQTIHQLLPTNWLSVLDHFMGLAVKGLKYNFLSRTDSYNFTPIPVAYLGTTRTVTVELFCEFGWVLNKPLDSARVNEKRRDFQEFKINNPLHLIQSKDLKVRGKHDISQKSEAQPHL